MKKALFIIAGSCLLALKGYAQTAQKDQNIKEWELSECIRYALEHNIKITQSKLNIADAEADKVRAIGAFLPTISFNASHSWNTGLNQNITTGLLQNNTVQYTSLGLGGSIAIFQGLQNVRQLHRSNMQILANRYQLDDMKDNTSLLVVNAFVQILFNQELLKVAEYQQRFTAQDVDKTAALVEAGSAAKGDLITLEANLASQQQAVQNAQNDLRLAQLNLAQLLLLEDIRVKMPAALDIEYSSILMISPEEIYEKSLQIRNNIKAAQANLDISKLTVKISKGAYYPTLRGTFGYNTRISYADRVAGRQLNSANPTSVIGVVEGTNQNVVTPNYTNLIEGYKNIFDQISENAGLSYGIGLNIPILSGLNARSQVRKSRIAVDVQTANLENLKQELRVNVYKAWSDLQNSVKLYEAAKKTQAARTEAFKYAQERLQQGVSSAFEYIQASANLESSNASLLRSKFDYILKTKIVEYYFGVPISVL